MFRKFRPRMLQNQVLHLRGKKDGNGKQEKPKQQKPECECICPPVHYRILTMDDMQLPYGNWKEQYQRRNKKYNLIFLFGLVSLIGSIAVLNKFVFFNAFPPPYPFDKQDIFECVDDDEDGEFECECEC
ncbi:uncharacterized protein LOC111030801 [Myzus persicae]|uniref:uncharacterized protein LOC111030801 n=1 Tax=Myzus persicae TaxID=13164 RepID=UPI000B9366A3|nr:uncharacterized protein LOC111030801 [Myzus persicae]